MLLPKVEDALREINPRPRQDQVAEVARCITTFAICYLIQNNKRVPWYQSEY